MKIINYNKSYLFWLKYIDDQWWENYNIDGLTIRLVVDDDNIPTGFYALRINSNLEILHLHVQEKYRNRGYGSLLHRDILRIAKNSSITIIRITIPEDNIYIPWLQSWGYRAVSLKRGKKDWYLFEKYL